MYLLFYAERPDVAVGYIPGKEPVWIVRVYRKGEQCGRKNGEENRRGERGELLVVVASHFPSSILLYYKLQLYFYRFALVDLVCVLELRVPFSLYLVKGKREKL